jgi:hypothetical protein
MIPAYNFQQLQADSPKIKNEAFQNKLSAEDMYTIFKAN